MEQPPHQGRPVRLQRHPAPPPLAVAASDDHTTTNTNRRRQRHHHQHQQPPPATITTTTNSQPPATTTTSPPTPTVAARDITPNTNSRRQRRPHHHHQHQQSPPATTTPSPPTPTVAARDTATSNNSRQRDTDCSSGSHSQGQHHYHKRSGSPVRAHRHGREDEPEWSHVPQTPPTRQQSKWRAAKPQSSMHTHTPQPVYRGGPPAPISAGPTWSHQQQAIKQQGAERTEKRKFLRFLSAKKEGVAGHKRAGRRHIHLPSPAIVPTDRSP